MLLPIQIEAADEIREIILKIHSKDKSGEGRDSKLERCIKLLANDFLEIDLGLGGGVEPLETNWKS